MLSGFSGKACEYRTCLGIDNECSGHGRCLPMQILAMQDTALPLSDTNHDNKVYYEIARKMTHGMLGLSRAASVIPLGKWAWMMGRPRNRNILDLIARFVAALQITIH